MEKYNPSNVFAPFFTEKELNATDALPEHKDKLLLLVKYILEPVRKEFGPIIITSGYRSPADNAALALKGYKPSPTSQHCLGEAVDFLCHKSSMIDVYNWIKANLKVGELFYYRKKGHVHVSLPNYKLIKSGKANIDILDE